MGRAPAALLAVLLFVDFADEWFTFLPAGALEPIRSDLGLTYGEVALLLVALSSGGLIGQGLVVATDFVSRRWLAAGGAFAYGLCLLAFALGDSLAVLLVAAFVWGAASDAFVYASQVALVDLARDDLAPMLARVNALGTVGDLMGPLMLIAGSAMQVSWRVVFGVGGAFMLIYAVSISLQRFPPPRPPADGHSPLGAIVAVVRDRRVIAFALVGMLYDLLDEPLLGFLIAYLETTRHLPPTLAIAVASAILVGGLIGFVTVAVVPSRLVATQALVGSVVIIGLSLAALVAAPVTALQASSAVVFGFAGAVFYSMFQARYLTLRPGQAGTSQALLSTMSLAGIGYPALVGAVADRWGLAGGLSLYIIVPAAMLLLLLGARQLVGPTRKSRDAAQP